MTATSGADSGNDDEEEDGSLGLDWKPQRGSRTKDRDEAPTAEYFSYTSLTVNFACIFAHRRHKYVQKSVSLLVLQLQTPVDVQPCFALILYLPPS